MELDLEKQLSRDIRTAKQGLVTLGMKLCEQALKLEKATDKVLQHMETVVACAELPRDMPLRVWLQPNFMSYKS